MKRSLMEQAAKKTRRSVGFCLFFVCFVSGFSNRATLQDSERATEMARIPLWKKPEGKECFLVFLFLFFCFFFPGDRDCIYRSFQFKNFDTAFFKFMTEVAKVGLLV